MRYFDIPTATFTAADGSVVPVKERRPRPGRAASSYAVQTNGATTLDDVATRMDAFGGGMEAETYRVFEENDLEIVEAGFDLSRLRSVRVPRWS